MPRGSNDTSRSKGILKCSTQGKLKLSTASMSQSNFLNTVRQSTSPSQRFFHQDPALRNNSGFRYTNTIRERLEEAVKKNALCDVEPSQLYKELSVEHCMKLRPVDSTKHIGPSGFKYKPNSYFEKFADKMQLQ